MTRTPVKPAPGSQPLPQPPEHARELLLVRIFQFPGNLVADLLSATKDDDRMAIRVLIDMLFWNVVAVLVAILAYSQFG